MGPVPWHPLKGSHESFFGFNLICRPNGHFCEVPYKIEFLHPPLYRAILEKQKMNENPNRKQHVPANYAGRHHQFQPRPEDMLAVDERDRRRRDERAK